MKFAAVGVLTYYRTLNLVFFRKLHETIQILRFYRHRHAFLTLRYPDLPEVQSFVFERHFVQFHQGTFGKPGRLTYR